MSFIFTLLFGFLLDILSGLAFQFILVVIGISMLKLGLEFYLEENEI